MRGYKELRLRIASTFSFRETAAQPKPSWLAGFKQPANGHSAEAGCHAGNSRSLVGNDGSIKWEMVTKTQWAIGDKGQRLTKGRQIALGHIIILIHSIVCVIKLRRRRRDGVPVHANSLSWWYSERGSGRVLLIIF